MPSAQSILENMYMNPPSTNTEAILDMLREAEDKSVWTSIEHYIVYQEENKDEVKIAAVPSMTLLEFNWLTVLLPDGRLKSIHLNKLEYTIVQHHEVYYTDKKGSDLLQRLEKFNTGSTNTQPWHKEA